MRRLTSSRTKKRARRMDKKGVFLMLKSTDILTLNLIHLSGYTKADKLALHKRDKFFQMKDGHLYYTGKGRCKQQSPSLPAKCS